MAYSEKDLEMFVWDKIWSGHNFNRIADIAEKMGYTDDMKLLKNIYDRLYSEYMEMYGEKMKDYGTKKGLTETKRISMSGLKKIIAESIMERTRIDEKFSSPKLAKMAREHGGISVMRNGGARNGANAWKYNRSVDVSTVTDDMIDDAPFYYDKTFGNDIRDNRCIVFNDGYAVGIHPDAEPNGTRRHTKHGSGVGDTGDHDKTASPFWPEAKTDAGPQYDGFDVSDAAGQARAYRNAMKFNRNAEADYRKMGIPDREQQARDDYMSVKREAGNLLKSKNHGKRSAPLPKAGKINENKNNPYTKNVVKINEEQLREMISEAISEALEDRQPRHRKGYRG